MSATAAAERLAKAEQFLAAARLVLGERLFDSAVSCAVSAGILATDTICLLRLGRFSVARNHAEALALARTAGSEGRDAAAHLDRLLALKNKAQYDGAAIGANIAARAVERAERVVELARQVRAG